MNVKYTDGVYFVMENNASWLVTDISVIVKSESCSKEEFVAVKFKVNEDNTAKVIYTDGNNKQLYTQSYGYTDFKKHFKENEVTFYYTDGVLMLSGEY
jgi:UDP-2,3-diacylglucosamine pyrophosphatase LpxH